MFTTTDQITAVDGATIIATTGDGIWVGTIGGIAFGSLTITIHGTTLIVTTDVTTMVIIIMDTIISDTIIIEDVLIHTLTDVETQDIETLV
jgi:hypothetical protein